MKRSIALFLAGVFVFIAGNVSAGNDLTGSGTELKKYRLKKKNVLNTYPRSADEGKDAFADGKIVLSLGYGGPNTWKNFAQAIIDSSENPTGVTATGLGPIHFRGEIALSNSVGLVASINYVSASVHWTSMNSSTYDIYNNSLERSSLSVLARLNFHFGVSEKVDPYFGFGMGYRTVTWRVSSDDPGVSGFVPLPFIPFGFETTIGLRYYFTPGFGIYGETGISKSVIQGGLVVAF